MVGFGWASHTYAAGYCWRVQKPHLIIPDGFTNNWVSAYALVADHYHRDDLSGGGLVADWCGGTTPSKATFRFKLLLTKVTCSMAALVIPGGSVNTFTLRRGRVCTSA